MIRFVPKDRTDERSADAKEKRSDIKAMLISKAAKSHPHFRTGGAAAHPQGKKPNIDRLLRIGRASNRKGVPAHKPANDPGDEPRHIRTAAKKAAEKEAKKLTQNSSLELIGAKLVESLNELKKPPVSTKSIRDPKTGRISREELGKKLSGLFKGPKDGNPGYINPLTDKPTEKGEVPGEVLSRVGKVAGRIKTPALKRASKKEAKK
jgi:hypothetical protein